MPVVQLEIRGLERVRLSVGQLRQKLTPVLSDAALHSVLYVQENLPPYPAKPPTSKYVRTHLLENSLHAMQGQAEGATSRVDKVGGMVRAFIGTNLEYARWVIDRDRQAWMHVGRWWLLQDEVLSQDAAIQAIFQDYINGFIARI